MSRQEIYAWCSLASSFAISGFYVLVVFGWPEDIPDYSAELTKVFINVFLFAFIIELILGFMETKDGIIRDERDHMIASKGFRNAYYFMVYAIVAMLAHYLFRDLLLGNVGGPKLIADANLSFHVLLLILFFASITNRATQIYYYRKDFLI